MAQGQLQMRCVTLTLVVVLSIPFFTAVLGGDEREAREMRGDVGGGLVVIAPSYCFLLSDGWIASAA